MLLAAYAATALLMLIFARRRRPQPESALKLAMLPEGVAVAVSGFLSLEHLDDDGVASWEDSRVAYVLWSLLTVGGVVFAAGSLRWAGKTAFVLRGIGWILVTAALVVPSTLTLALPITGFMFMTLIETPGSASTSAASKASRLAS